MTAPRSSITLALAGLALLLILVLFLHRTPARAAPDLSAVAESDRWKFTDAGRTRHLDELRAGEARAASSYAWIDESRGVVRLPVEAAMEITLKEIASSRR